MKLFTVAYSKPLTTATGILFKLIFFGKKTDFIKCRPNGLRRRTKRNIFRFLEFKKMGHFMRFRYLSFKMHLQLHVPSMDRTLVETVKCYLSNKMYRLSSAKQHRLLGLLILLRDFPFPQPAFFKDITKLETKFE